MAVSEKGTIARRYTRWLGKQLRTAGEHFWRTSSYESFAPLVVEFDNVRQALKWTLLARDPDAALELTSAPDYWAAIARTPEGHSWLARVREEVVGGDDDPRVATLQFGVALCAIQSGMPALALARACSTLAHGVGATFTTCSSASWAQL